MSIEGITIRRARLGDAEAIAGIYNHAVLETTATFDTEPQNVETREEWIQAHDNRFPAFVAEVDGEVVGWAALSKWSDRSAYAKTAESSFYVSKSHRGCGIGRALKQTLILEAQQLGFHTILARVSEGSDASLHINESFGFQRIGTMKQVGFKFGRWLDVHLLQLMLADSSR